MFTPRVTEGDYIKQLGTAQKAISLHLPGSYSWLGTRRAMTKKFLLGMSSEDARSYLEFALQQDLYRYFYCTGGRVIEATESRPARASAAYVTALSAANAGEGSWQDDWIVDSSSGKQLVASRNGLRVLLEDGDTYVLHQAPSGQKTISVHAAKEMRYACPGYYLALGNAGGGGHPASTLRWYWNVTPLGAIEVVRILTECLNKEEIPFQLKALNDPSRYSRCDSVVLYTQKGNYAALAPLIEATHRQIEVHARVLVPAFTKWLAPGLAIAEDPGNGESFGSHRCKLLAEGIVRARQGGHRTISAERAFINDHFTASGLDITHPFLSAGSADHYTSFNSEESVWLNESILGETAAKEKGASVRSQALEHALDIGRELIDSAQWSDSFCTWFGSQQRVPNPTGGQPTKAWGTIGPALYQGSAGVALFLAELAACTENSDAAKTAEAAIRHSLLEAKAQRPDLNSGLFTGRAGVAYVAVRIGEVLGNPNLTRAGVELLAEIDCEKGTRDFDLISGLAGVATACLAAHALADSPQLVDVASSAGKSLIKASVRTAGGIAWKPSGSNRRKPLTGLSHGTAGAALALLEIQAVTGVPAYREAAEAAFAYERKSFDASEGNWPDYRWATGRGGRPSFATSWCHGAPGIALSRARSWSLTNDSISKNEAIVGLTTTAAAISSNLNRDTADKSLCHGLIGNIEVLNQASILLGKEDKDQQELVHRANWQLCQDQMSDLQTYGDKRLFADPGLMLGAAGLGMFFLRMSGKNVKSVLLLSCK